MRDMLQTGKPHPLLTQAEEADKIIAYPVYDSEKGSWEYPG